MKNFLLFVFSISAPFLFSVDASAQHRNLTIVLVRHAEKDVSATADKVNPELTAEGKQRARRLVKKVKKYKPDAIFSTNFIRTKETAQPLADKRKLAVQIYDHRNLKAMVEKIMSGEIKRLVIVGHNSTTPALVNLLIGQEKYKALLETEYDKIFVVKVYKKKTKPNKVKDKVIVY